MQIGIVGFPYSGKTTLFQTITNTHLDANALQKRDTNQAIVKVPDKRLDKLNEIFNPKKSVNATIEFVDLVGVQKTDSLGSLFNSQFMGKVKTNDALLHVVRGFEDDAVPHISGSVDIFRDIRSLEDELILSDLAFCETRIEKLNKDLMKQKNKDDVKKELEIFHVWHEALSNDTALRDLEMGADEQKFLKNYQPLTAKPLLIAVNLSENDVKNVDQIMAKVNELIGDKKNIKAEPFFAKIEMELAQLADDEKQMFLEEYGLTNDSPLERLIAGAYLLLGLQSFFTAGDDENRAWTIRKGMTAQDSAGVIHTDFYNKFIRAEVVGYEDFISVGTFAKCKEKGTLRLEGKEYIVKDGDILNIRHG